MASVLQFLGLAYLVFMIYLSFLYYKRNNYSLQSFIFWIVVWAGGGTLVLLPENITILTQKLTIVRVLDFYMIIGLLFFSSICFFNYASVKKNEARIEELVRKVALRKK
jgi:hypothetical protein